MHLSSTGRQTTVLQAVPLRYGLFFFQDDKVGTVTAITPKTSGSLEGEQPLTPTPIPYSSLPELSYTELNEVGCSAGWLSAILMGWVGEALIS